MLSRPPAVRAKITNTCIDSETQTDTDKPTKQRVHMMLWSKKGRKQMSTDLVPGNNVPLTHCVVLRKSLSPIGFRFVPFKLSNLEHMLG